MSSGITPCSRTSSRQEDGPAVRDMVWNADRLALNEAKRVFTNSKNVKERLWTSLRIPAEVLYHPSPVMEHLMDQPSGPFGEYVLFPSRMESLKRQSLVVDAMQHVKTAVGLVLVGRGRTSRRSAIRWIGWDWQQRVRFEIDVTDERLFQLYGAALAVYYGPFDEDYGYVTLEGFAADRPVVTLADSGGPLEFVVDGETGLVAAPDPGRSRTRSTGSTPTATSRRGWASPATRWSGPTFPAGRTSSRDCWIDAPRRRSNAHAPRGAGGARIGGGAGVLGTAAAGSDGCRHVRPRGAGRPASHRVLRPAPDGCALAARTQARHAAAGIPARRVRAWEQRRVPSGGLPRRVPRAVVADRAA